MTLNTLWIKLGALFTLASAALAMVFWFDLQEILQPHLVADWLREAGPFGPIVFIALMAAAVVISPIPSLPLDIAAGATFGPMWGRLML